MHTAQSAGFVLTVGATRSEKQEISFKPVDYRIVRFKDFPLPYLTEILNVDKMKKNNGS